MEILRPNILFVSIKRMTPLGYVMKFKTSIKCKVIEFLKVDVTSKFLFDV